MDNNLRVLANSVSVPENVKHLSRSALPESKTSRLAKCSTGFQSTELPTVQCELVGCQLVFSFESSYSLCVLLTPGGSLHHMPHQRDLLGPSNSQTPAEVGRPEAAEAH